MTDYKLNLRRPVYIDEKLHWQLSFTVFRGIFTVFLNVNFTLSLHNGSEQQQV